VKVEHGANWQLLGHNTLGVGTSLQVDGLLNVRGSLADTGNVVVETGGRLAVTWSGHAAIGSLTLSGGVVNVAPRTGAELTIGAGAAGALGKITVNSGAEISGFGRLAPAVVDNGQIIAQGGKLVFNHGVSGSGTVTLDNGATVIAHGDLSMGTLAFAGGNATLMVTAADLETTSIAGFGASDVIDLEKFQAGSLSFSGHTLTLDHAGTAVAEFTFDGNYTSGNFMLSSDGNGGVDLKFMTAASDDAAHVRIMVGEGHMFG